MPAVLWFSASSPFLKMPWIFFVLSIRCRTMLTHLFMKVFLGQCLQKSLRWEIAFGRPLDWLIMMHPTKQALWTILPVHFGLLQILSCYKLKVLHSGCHLGNSWLKLSMIKWSLEPVLSLYLPVIKHFRTLKPHLKVLACSKSPKLLKTFYLNTFIDRSTWQSKQIQRCGLSLLRITETNNAKQNGSQEDISRGWG